MALRMIKCVFHKEKLDPIDTVNEKHIYPFARPDCCKSRAIWGHSNSLKLRLSVGAKHVFSES